MILNRLPALYHKVVTCGTLYILIITTKLDSQPLISFEISFPIIRKGEPMAHP